MAKERSVDEYLGFAPPAKPESDFTQDAQDAVLRDDAADEDSWYQVLKAQADEHDGADAPLKRAPGPTPAGPASVGFHRCEWGS